MQGTGNKVDNGVRTRKGGDASFIVKIILILFKKKLKGSRVAWTGLEYDLELLILLQILGLRAWVSITASVWHWELNPQFHAC